MIEPKPESRLLNLSQSTDKSSTCPPEHAYVPLLCPPLCLSPTSNTDRRNCGLHLLDIPSLVKETKRNLCSILHALPSALKHSHRILSKICEGDVFTTPAKEKASERRGARPAAAPAGRKPRLQPHSWVCPYSCPLNNTVVNGTDPLIMEQFKPPPFKGHLLGGESAYAEGRL